MERRGTRKKELASSFLVLSAAVEPLYCSQAMADSVVSLYNQDEKNECRSRLIKHAIKCLTTERDTSVCVTPYHVINIWTNLLKTQEAMQHFSFEERQAITNAIEGWKIFHESCLQIKTPQNLRVCYLAGDNPMNDLQVLVDNGILTQNIWAIEKDATMIESVVKTINHQSLKNFKLFKGDIINFLIDLEGQFDIIYYDACGTLPSKKQNTLKVIGTVFLHNKLTSPGALITNFSFPPEQASEQDTKSSSPQGEERNRIMFLAERYLQYRELNTPAFQDNSENYENIPANINTRTAEDTYSDYITYQVIDAAAVYIPAQRMLLSGRMSLWDQLYTNKLKFLEKVKLYDTGKEYSETASTSYLRKIGSAIMMISGNDLCRNWVNEIFPNWKTSSLKKEEISSLLMTHHLSCSEEFIAKFANKDFQERCLLREALDPDTNGAIRPSFCDTLDAASATRLVGGIQYGQLANPSFPVVDQLLRLRYTAKKRTMFSDVFIFDKCRYFYDQFPSVDFAINSIKSEQQMLIKMIVNGLRTHLREICYDQFCNVADLHVNSLQIPQRQNVYVDSPDLLHEADLQDAL